MNSSWRLKAYFALFATLLSIYLLIPSIYNFRSIREAAEVNGESVPWYVKLFPDKQLNLGLDIQGGIYLELEVVLDDALKQRSQIMAGEIERYLKSEKIVFERVGVLPGTATVEILLKNSDDILKVKNHVRQVQGSQLESLDRPPVLFYRVSSGDPQTFLNQLNEWKKQEPDVLDIQPRENTFEIILSSPEHTAKIQEVLASRWSELTSFENPNSVYFVQSKAYQDQLKNETLRQAVETIRNRIDRYGVAEPVIQRLGENRVAIEMPGVKDPERAIALAKRAGKLEFKLVDDSVEEAQIKTWVSEVKNEQNIGDLDFSIQQVDKVNQALKGKIPTDSEVAFEIQYDPINKKVIGGTPYLLKRKVEVSGDMLQNVQVNVQNNEPYVSLIFNPEGAKVFADLTSGHVGKRLAILLDGNVDTAPQIKNPITTGEAQITLGFGDYQTLIREAEDLVVVLREGALPATLKEATKTVIGPSLGKASIERGFQAIVLGALVVMVFMALWFRGAGLVADLAVVLNVLFIFAALTLFGATLTLPGVAGIVLTIGMAVDANVIILERVKEELALGKNVKAAVDLGYSSVTSAVVDANITTFLSGVVLYQFGTGPVRGFAVTLMIGIATTLATALVITRLFYDYRLSRSKNPKISLLWRTQKTPKS